MPFLSHRQELDDVRRTWRQSNQPKELEEARRRLSELRRQFPYVLAVGHELVLILDRLKKQTEAIALLRELKRQFRQLDEETLCRWGAIIKRRGRDADEAGDLPTAIKELRESATFYARASDINHWFYPRINELTVDFLRADLYRRSGELAESQSLLSAVQTRARALLADPAAWVLRQDDDSIWAPATRGEAHLLLGEWAKAADWYQKALDVAEGKQFYAHCMREQVKMLLSAARGLGLLPERPLDQPDEFFGISRADTVCPEESPAPPPPRPRAAGGTKPRLKSVKNPARRRKH